MESTIPQADSTDLPFEQHAREVISNFRRAFGDLMDALPVELGAGPTEVARQIKIDTKLAWKIAHLLDNNDPFEAGRFIPGMAAVRRLLKVVSGHRPPAPVMKAMRSACEEFEAMVKFHARDRRSFDLMLAGLSQGGQLRVEIEQRKIAHHSNSFLWGVQARAQIKTTILAPSSDPGMVDCAIINGFLDLRRIRSHVPWRITSTYSVDDHGEVCTDFESRPLDPELAKAGDRTAAPLLPGFCSNPLPVLNRVGDDKGALDFALGQGPLGRGTPETCLTGELIRAVEPRYRQPGFDFNAVGISMRTPCEVVVLDVLVHRGLFGRVEYEPSLYSDLFSGHPLTQYLDCDKLSLAEKVIHLGSGVEVARLPAMPRYREMLQFAFDSAGWRGEEFEVYRISIDYPITPTDMVLRNKLPNRVEPS